MAEDGGLCFRSSTRSDEKAGEETSIKTFEQFMTEALAPSEEKLAAPGHKVLTSHPYEYNYTGHSIQDNKWKQFSYKHPKTGAVVHTFVNKRANPDQRIQHQVGNKWVSSGNLRTALASREEMGYFAEEEEDHHEFTKKLIGGNAPAEIEKVDRDGTLAKHYPEIKKLQGVAQPPKHHPEGDTYTHTMLLLHHLPPGTASAGCRGLSS